MGFIYYTSLFQQRTRKVDIHESSCIQSPCRQEGQYSARRRHISEYCSVKGANFSVTSVQRNYSLLYNPGDGVSYCQIAKVASSTWCSHFIKLGRPCYLSFRSI